ncbi:MAG: MFS transporter [Chloroflexi bacterium]|nr:MFS transporter [Chloroflexota bacterium]
MAQFAYMPVQAAAQGISFIGRQSRDWRVTVARTSLDRLVYQMVFPYQSIFIVALGATATQLGAINSAGMVAAAILGPSTGWLIDRVGAKRVYLAGIGMLVVSYLAYSLAQSWPVALLAMVGYWLGFSTSILGCATVCGNCLASRDRATGMMICETAAAGLLGMAGPLIGAWLVASSGGVGVNGIRPLFVVGTVATVATFVLVLTQLSDRRWVNVRTAPKHMFRDLHQVLKDGQHLKRWLVLSSIAQLPTAMIFPFSQVFAHEVKGADAYVLGAMVTGCAVTSIIFGIPLGRLADRSGRKTVLYIAIPLFWISNLILVWAPNSAFLILAGVLQGFFFIAGPIGAAMERELVPAEQMGRWMGIARFFRMLFGALMAFVAGILWDGVGPQYVFLGFVALDLLLRLPLLVGMPETLRSRVVGEAPPQIAGNAGRQAE